ncbi:tetratricopeptide repeat protein [Jannaschia pohangensis]|uniref:Flp pilus assembly protein TadD, contains TPR repeats n=1 Tax=Jannaschia pohangensis TaxID=390807 RepID=A0A1I3MSW1_9RHOB|nr:tetratricopeptide repeat protein [Jannaschia pohangensis]SFJ00184.1 Flp pilus assembly protein TadD, contains TPR repeats [Jannaschia pohangensis]
MFRSLLLAATLLTPMAATAQGIAGPYLAARIAGYSNDYAAAGEYYARLMRRDEATAGVLENAVIIFSVLGRFDKAVEAADALAAAGQPSQFSDSARMVTLLRDGNFSEAPALLEEDGVGGALLDGLLAAWIAAGAGEMNEALAAFDTMAEAEGFATFAYQHKALALALAGDYEGADEIFSGRAHGPLSANTRMIAAHVQVLVQLDRADDARELLTQANEATNSPMLEDLARRLDAGAPVPFDMVRSATDGAAEAYFTLAALLVGESSTTFTLLNARAAVALRPDHVDGLILVSNLLEQQGQYDLANDVLATVPSDDPSFFGAEIARGEVLLSADKTEAALEVFQALTRSHGDEPSVWLAYSDALRRLERFEEAAAGYDRTIEMQGEITPRDWFLYYARGIARERTGDWEGAESDFRRALELNPEDPNVLNYLGYGLVEQRMKLDEALDMIERAVAGRPDDGYITDSLGWVLYRLGRYEEAVAPMERAVELRPLDPLINDHLGDVLWTVGRQREAEFQWKRALSLDPEEQEDRIRRKLEVGLDVVLEEEGGAGPIEAANE